MNEVEVFETAPTDVDELLVVQRAVDADEEPDFAEIGAAELALTLFEFSARRPQRTWLARLEGRPAGIVRVRLPIDANPTHAEVFTAVAPDARRHGVARALVATSLQAVADQRDTVTAWAPVGAGSAMCDGLGLSNRQIVRQSRLTVGALDAAQQRDWMQAERARNAGYRVVCWRGPYPESLMTEICEAFKAMDDAPLDDVEAEFPAPTPERLRDEIRAVEGRLDPFGALALGPDGEPAGVTELGVNLFRPAIGHQGDTGVLAGHRGLALGRWLKAVNLAAALEAHPQLMWVSTFNAESNPWMLTINEAMGFAPHRTYYSYQGPMHNAREALAS